MIKLKLKPSSVRRQNIEWLIREKSINKSKQRDPDADVIELTIRKPRIRSQDEGKSKMLVATAIGSITWPIANWFLKSSISFYQKLLHCKRKNQSLKIVVSLNNSFCIISIQTLKKNGRIYPEALLEWAIGKLAQDSDVPTIWEI